MLRDTNSIMSICLCVYTSDAFGHILIDHMVAFNVVTQIFCNIIDYIFVSVIVMSEI